jgi:hypothetical protein
MNDFNEVLSKSLEFFDDVVVREQIYKYYLKRMKIQDEISKLYALFNFN